MNMLFVGQIKFMDDIISLVKNLDKYKLDLFIIYFYPMYIFYFVSAARDGVVNQGVYHLFMPVSAAR